MYKTIVTLAKEYELLPLLSVIENNWLVAFATLFMLFQPAPVAVTALTVVPMALEDGAVLKAETSTVLEQGVLQIVYTPVLPNALVTMQLSASTQDVVDTLTACEGGGREGIRTEVRINNQRVTADLVDVVPTYGLICTPVYAGEFMTTCVSDGTSSGWAAEVVLAVSAECRDTIGVQVVYEQVEYACSGRRDVLVGSAEVVTLACGG